MFALKDFLLLYTSENEKWEPNGYTVSGSKQDLLGPEEGTSFSALPKPCESQAVAGRASAYTDEHLSGLGSEHLIGVDIRAVIFLSGIAVCNHTSCTGRVCP